MSGGGTVFQRFVNSLHGGTHHPFVDMRVQGVGELTEHDTHWQLTHDDCGHVQVFALEGLDDPAAAAFLVRRLYAKCPTCALANTAVAAETPLGVPEQFHLVLSHAGLTAIVAAVAALRVVGLAALAERLDAILPKSSRPP